MNRIFLALRAKVGWLQPFPNPDIDAANHPTITSQSQPRLNCFPNHIPAARSHQTDDPALGKHPRLNHPSCRTQERFRHNHPTSVILQLQPLINLNSTSTTTRPLSDPIKMEGAADLCDIHKEPRVKRGSCVSCRLSRPQSVSSAWTWWIRKAL